MPILKEYILGSKEVTAVIMGTGDVHINTCVKPKNAIYLAQHEPKPVNQWKLGDSFNYEGVPNELGEYDGNVIWMEFGRVESIDALIETLQECKLRMMNE